MVEGRIIAAGLMLGFFVTMVAVAFTYGEEARFMPLVIGIPGSLLSATQFAIELRSGRADRATPSERSATFRMLGWFAAFIGGIILFGFPYAGPILVMLYLRLSWHEKWYICLAAGLSAWAVLYGVFEHFLGLPLFDGLIAEWLL